MQLSQCYKDFQYGDKIEIAVPSHNDNDESSHNISYMIMEQLIRFTKHCWWYKLTTSGPVSS